ncbi:MAG: hypothetical protein KBT28_07450 [Bacteroidales bacterium]|nr:hypothetical protein [Candidatus Colimorpha merdihippi]
MQGFISCVRHCIAGRKDTTFFPEWQFFAANCFPRVGRALPSQNPMQKYEHFLTDYFSDLENEKNVPFFVFDAQNRPFFALQSPSESKIHFLMKAVNWLPKSADS